MRKYVVLAAAILLHLCLGGLYAWSTFVPALRADFGYSAAQMQTVFGLTVAVLCLGSVVAGRIQDLSGPRVVACISGVLLGAGYLLAGFGGHRYLWLLLGFSVLGGLSVSFGYIASVATAAKWFPERRGMAAGLVVAGYGAAAIVLSAVAEPLLNRGWSAPDVFKLVGVVYGPVALTAGLCLVLPAHARPAPHALAFRRRGLWTDRWFWFLLVAMFCGTYPGLALIGALKPMGLWFGYAPAVATASVSALAVGNGAGRIAWGAVHDRLKRRGSVLLLLAAITASTAGVAAGGLHPALFLGSALLLGFCYGGALSLLPAEVAELYGVHVMGSVYPIVLLGHALAGILGAPVTGLGADRTGGYWPGILVALLVGAVGFTLCGHIRRCKK